MIVHFIEFWLRLPIHFWHNIQPFVMPWKLPYDWKPTGIMTDEELAAEARTQHHLIRAVGWHDSAVFHASLMNQQYLRCTQAAGSTRYRPYMMFYAMVVGFAVAGAVIVSVNMSRTAATSYSAWAGEWWVGASIGAAMGLFVGAFAGLSTLATMQFKGAYAPTWYYQPKYGPCLTCQDDQIEDMNDEEEREYAQWSAMLSGDVAEAMQEKCTACDGTRETELLECECLGFAHVLRLSTIDNPNILFAGSGQTAGFADGALFLKAPKGRKLSEMKDTKELSSWSSAFGTFIGENDRETRNKFTDAEEAGKRNPYRHSKPFSQTLKEWSGALALGIAFIGSIFYYQMTVDTQESPVDRLAPEVSSQAQLDNVQGGP